MNHGGFWIGNLHRAHEHPCQAHDLNDDGLLQAWTIVFSGMFGSVPGPRILQEYFMYQSIL